MFYLDHFKIKSSLSLTVDLVYSEKGLIYLGLNEFNPPKFVPSREELIHTTHFKFREAFSSYLNGEKESFGFDLDLRTTEFRKRIYSALRTIPYGEVLTYQDIAKMVDRPKGQRAVGQAVGENPLPIIIPCHRVVAKNHLGGFSLGLDLKKSLLEIENSIYLRESKQSS